MPHPIMDHELMFDSEDDMEGASRERCCYLENTNYVLSLMRNTNCHQLEHLATLAAFSFFPKFGLGS